MTLTRRRAAAVVGAALTSTIALADAVTHGMTGRNLLPSDNTGPTGVLIAGDLLHGLTYAALGWVLFNERTPFQLASRFVRALRRVLLASLTVLAAGFVLIAPVLPLAHVAPSGYLPSVWGGIAGIGFAGMIMSALLIGVGVLRNNPLGSGGRILRLLLPVTVVTVLLGLLRSDWAHPGYVETLIYSGVALLGAHAASDSATTRPHPEGHHPNGALVDAP